MVPWVIANDFHYPYHDTPVVRGFLKFVEWLKPHGIILNGDVMDCYILSSFNRDPMTPLSLDHEINGVRKLLSQIARLGVPVKIIGGGNHEDRLRRYLWKNTDIIQKMGTRAARMICETINIPNLLGISDYGFDWFDYQEYYRIGQLFITHGKYYSVHSSYAAKRQFDKAGASCIVGHSHHLGSYYKTNLLGRPHVVIENGCLCDLNPDYDPDPNWQQGFSVVYVDPRTKLFHIETIPIINRKWFMFGDKLFKV